MNKEKKKNKSKIYEFIGRAVVYVSLYIGTILFGIWAFMQNIVY